MKYADKMNIGGEGDYVKNLLNKNTSFMRSNLGSQNGGLQIGQSRGFGSSSNFSGKNSTTSTGGGLASRFSLALSRIIEPSKIEDKPVGENNEDEDILNLI